MKEVKCMQKEVETVTKEFEKLFEENRDKIMEEMKEKRITVDQIVSPPSVKCNPGEVCHGGDIYKPK